MNLIIVITILWIMIISSVVMLTKFNNRFILGITSTSIVTILVFFNRKISVYLLIFTLLVASASFITFSLQFGVKVFRIVDVISLLLFTFLLYSERKIMIELYDTYFVKSKEHNQFDKKAEIKHFENLFSNLSQIELERKYHDDLTDEAKTAINNIMLKNNQKSIIQHD